jgi:hypothetical protein
MFLEICPVSDNLTPVNQLIYKCLIQFQVKGGLCILMWGPSLKKFKLESLKISASPFPSNFPHTLLLMFCVALLYSLFKMSFW